MGGLRFAICASSVSVVNETRLAGVESKYILHMSYDNLKSKIKYLNLIISYNLTQNSEIIIVSFTKQPKVYNLEISFVTQS